MNRICNCPLLIGKAVTQPSERGLVRVNKLVWTKNKNIDPNINLQDRIIITQNFTKYCRQNYVLNHKLTTFLYLITQNNVFTGDARK